MLVAYAGLRCPGLSHNVPLLYCHNLLVNCAIYPVLIPQLPIHNHIIYTKKLCVIVYTNKSSYYTGLKPS